MKVLWPIALVACASVAAAVGVASWGGRPCPSHHFAIIGDSNVSGMDLGPGCLNLGIGGSTTRQMAERFSPRDTASKQAALVIWTTTNDIHAGQQYGVTYIRQMALAARAAGMGVILTTPLPMIDKSQIPPRGTRTLAQMDADLVRLRADLLELGAHERFAVADVHGAVVDDAGKIDLRDFYPDPDGSIVHLNRRGRAAVWHVITALLPS